MEFQSEAHLQSAGRRHHGQFAWGGTPALTHRLDRAVQPAVRLDGALDRLKLLPVIQIQGRDEYLCRKDHLVALPALPDLPQGQPPVYGVSYQGGGLQDLTDALGPNGLIHHLAHGVFLGLDLQHPSGAVNILEHGDRPLAPHHRLGQELQRHLGGAHRCPNGGGIQIGKDDPHLTFRVLSGTRNFDDLRKGHGLPGCPKGPVRVPQEGVELHTALEDQLAANETALLTGWLSPEAEQLTTL